MGVAWPPPCNCIRSINQHCPSLECIIGVFYTGRDVKILAPYLCGDCKPSQFLISLSQGFILYSLGQDNSVLVITHIATSSTPLGSSARDSTPINSYDSQLFMCFDDLLWSDVSIDSLVMLQMMLSLQFWTSYCVNKWSKIHGFPLDKLTPSTVKSW